MSKSSKMATLICGVAMGVAIGYFLNSDKKDEYLDIAREKAGKLKDKAGELKDKAGELKTKVKDKLSKKADELEEVATN